MTTTVDMVVGNSNRSLGEIREEAYQRFVSCRKETIDILKTATRTMDEYKLIYRIIFGMKMIFPIASFVLIYLYGIICGISTAIVITCCFRKLGASTVISKEIGEIWNEIIQADNQALVYHQSFLSNPSTFSYQASSTVFSIFASFAKDAIQIAFDKLRATQRITDTPTIDGQHVNPIPVLLGIVTLMSNCTARQTSPEELRQLADQMEQQLVTLQIRHCKEQLTLLCSYFLPKICVGFFVVFVFFN